MVVVEIPEEPTVKPMDIIGVDMGVVNIAVDSTGKYYPGDHIKDVREQSSCLYSRLQSAGTKSAKRHLQKLSGKERGLARNTNHVISKEIVQKAKGTSSAIAMENLECVRMRITVRKGNRYIHNSCSFHQIRLFKEYKGKRSGHLPHRGQPAQHQQGMPQLSLN
jgi:transposase